MIESARNSFYRVLEIFTAFLLLNIIWLLFCLLIIPIYPATAAMFGVVRKWKTEGVDYGAVKPFFRLLKENWKKSFQIGFIWSFIGIVLAVDFYLINNLLFPGKIMLLSLLIFCGILYVFSTIYLFPIFVNFELPIKAVLKNALLLSIGKAGITLICFLFIVIIFVIVYFFPVFVLVFGSLTAFVTYTICSKSFQN